MNNGNKIKKFFFSFLTAFLSISYSSYAISLEQKFEPGESIVAMRMLKDGKADGFAAIDLYMKEFKFLARNKMIVYPFTMTEFSENKICFKFKNKKKSKSKINSCAIKATGDYFVGEGFLERYNKRYKFISLKLITDKNIQSTLLGTKWTSAGVNDCNNDFYVFYKDYRVYSEFSSGNEKYSYKAKIKFKKNGLINEAGNDMNGDLVENDNRIFVDSINKRLFIQFVLSKDPETLQWNVLGDGHWYKSCSF